MKDTAQIEELSKQIQKMYDVCPSMDWDKIEELSAEKQIVSGKNWTSVKNERHNFMH